MKSSDQIKRHVPSRHSNLFIIGVQALVGSFVSTMTYESMKGNRNGEALSHVEKLNQQAANKEFKFPKNLPPLL